MKQYHALTTMGRELIDEQAGTTEQDIGSSLDKGKTVVDVAGGNQKLMFSHLHQPTLLQTEGNNLTYKVARERNIPWSLRLSQKEWQTRKEASGCPFHRFKANLHPRMLPE